MSQLRDICIQVRYRGEANDLVEKFLEPVAHASTILRARVGSLTADGLRPLALALPLVLEQKTTIKLLVEAPPNANPSDPKGIADEMERRLAAISSALPSGDSCRDDSAYRLDSKFAVAMLAVSDPRPGVTVFFTDEGGSSVAFDADWNPNAGESGGGRLLSVAWTWGDPTFRLKQEIGSFDRAWKGECAECRALPSDEGFRNELIRILLALSKQAEECSPDDGGIRLFPHQDKAVKQWETRSFLGVFKMCTGAGKTISALAGVGALTQRRVEASLPSPPVIITVPTRVLADQWIREIKRFGFRSVLAAYNAFEQWNSLLEPMLRDKNPEQPRFIVTTYRTFSDARFLAKLQRAAEFCVEALWIADEMHNLASPRLRDAMRRCSSLFKFRLGLSATPEIEGDLTATEALLNYFGNICASYELADGIRDEVLCKYLYYPIPAYLAPALGKKYLSLLKEIDDESAGSTALVNLYREARHLLRTSGVQIARFRDLLSDLVAAVPDLKHTLVYCPPGYGTCAADVTDEIDNDEDDRRLIEEVIEVLRSKSLSPASILGETPGEQRAQILERFADGRARTLCAIGCLDEGVDVPAIKRAVVLYSVDREKQFVQRRGRILRQPRGTQAKVAEIYDIVILPQGSDMPRAQAEALLIRELRRYREFARLAENRREADESISKALAVAAGGDSTKIMTPHGNKS